MTAALSHHDRTLLDAAATADIMAAAGRMIANPWRARLSLAEQLAMSIALERAQGAVIEARLLLAALEMPETGNEREMAVKDHAIQTQTHRLRAELAALDGQANTENEEKNHAGSHS